MKNKRTRNDLEESINVNAWINPKFKAQLKQSPKDCLSEMGLNVPTHVKIIVHEEDENTMHIVLRKEPKGNLSEKELHEIYTGKSPSTGCGCS